MNYFINRSNNLTNNSDIKSKNIDAKVTKEKEYALETKIRDEFFNNFNAFVKDTKETVNTKETKIGNRRIDLISLKSDGEIRIWEFKKKADNSTIGQTLNYIALKRKQTSFKRKVSGVIAAFEFDDDLKTTVNIMSLPITLFELPDYLKKAGATLKNAKSLKKPKIIKT